MTTPVHIVAARRTPIGRFGGAFAELSSAVLGAAAIRQVLADSGVDPAIVDEAIIGQVLTAGAGMNPARQAAIGGGLPIGVPAFSVNKVCGSGLKAIHLGAQAIGAGDAQLVVAGGQESMTQAPHLLAGRRATKLGHPIGASGCRVVVTLLHEMRRRNARRGLATLCIGGGQGVAICIER